MRHDLYVDRVVRRFSAASNSFIFVITNRLHKLLRKSEKQIPHRLKPVRDDKNKEPATARLS
jgi:hypothetical protein